MSNIAGNYQKIKASFTAIEAFNKKTIQFPRTADLFDRRYGKFSDQSEVRNFLISLGAFDYVIERVGGREQLRAAIAADPSCLSRPAMPEKDVYSKIVWLSNQISNACTDIVITFKSLNAILDPASGSSPERAKNLVESITGTSGLRDILNTMGRIAVSISGILEQLVAEYQKAFASISNTSLLEEANQTIGRLRADNRLDNARIAKLKSSAGSISEIFSRNKNKKELEELLLKVEANEKEIERKELLTKELNTEFFLNGKKLSGVLADTRQGLSDLGNYFFSQAERLYRISTVSSEEQLADFDWVSRAFELDATIASWQEIEAESAQYAKNAVTGF